MRIALLAIYGACIFAAEPSFFAPVNLGLLAFYTGLLLPAALGVQMLIVLGLFDLSVGAVAAASGVVAAKAMSLGLSPAASVVLGIGTGLLFGGLNWALVSMAKISALIGTLITMGVARATAVGLTKGQTLAGLPAEFAGLVQGSLGGISFVVGFGLTSVLVLELLTRRHVLFRRLYHAGSNRTAASENGLSIPRLEALGFLCAGSGAACVGLLQSSRTLSASPHEFQDLALDCIAACVVGGSQLKGGTGRAAGALLGLLIVVMSRNLVVLAGVSVYWKDLAVAAVLLTAALSTKMQKP